MDSEIQKSDGGGDEPGRKSKRPRPVTVKVVERQRKAVLVEWVDKKGQYGRVTIPTSELQGDKADAEVLAQGVPYGVDWAEKFSHLPGADILANELRRQGIWTKEDFMRGRATARAVMMRVFVNPLVDELVKEL